MTDRLEERLEALREDPPRGDWLDVRRRVRRRRARRVATVLVAATLVAVALVPLGVSGRIVDLLTVEKTEEELPKPAATMPPYVFGDRVYRDGRETRLAQTLIAPFLGQQSFLAVTSPDRASFVYHSWRGSFRGPGPSLLRRHHLDSGRDEVLVSGAQSFAWRSDGAVAYMRALRPRYVPNDRAAIPSVYVGHVEVRSAPEGPARRWTTEPTGYIVRAWAGETLLVEVHPSLVMPDDQPDAGVYALEGPGRMRLLPITDLIAVSPDGRRAVGRWRQGDGVSRTLRLVDVASGRTLSQIQLLNGASGPGDWRGDTVVGVSALGRKSSLVVLRAGESLVVREKLALDERAGLTGYLGAHFHLPLFVSDDEVVVSVTTVAKDEADSRVRFLTCDLTERKCRSGRELLPLTRWAAVLANPSRP
jgi:hypothetical protein